MPEKKRSLHVPVFTATIGACAALGAAAPSAANTRIPPAAPCAPVGEPAPGTPMAPDSVIIVLPRTLDPRGCPIRTQHGTRIFRIVEQDASWTTVEAGGTVQNDWGLPGLVAHAQRFGSQILVEMRDGERIVLPGNAVIHPPDGSVFSFAYVAPGRPVPHRLLGVAPDYVVP